MIASHDAGFGLWAIVKVQIMLTEKNYLVKKNNCFYETLTK